MTTAHAILGVLTVAGLAVLPALIVRRINRGSRS